MSLTNKHYSIFYFTMLSWFFNTTHSQSSKKEEKQGRECLSVSFRPENFVPGLMIGFILGLFIDIVKANKANAKTSNLFLGKHNQHHKGLAASNAAADEDLKMVLIVRRDLKMGPGKIASQCAHAATGMYAELIQGQRYLLKRWEQCGQAKIVLTCKNQQEMNKLKDSAEAAGLPTFVVADAGRTEVLAGSKTVLAIGPGRKSSIDSVTGKLRLL